MKNYQSTAWVVWRGVWLFDFTSEFVGNVVNHRNWVMSDCAIRAYEKALERHHPWLIKKSAKIGMLTVRSRENFFNSVMEQQSRLMEKQYTEANIYEDLKRFVEICLQIKQNLTNFFETHRIDDIP